MELTLAQIESRGDGLLPGWSSFAQSWADRLDAGLVV